ncbi:hypothetical protein [Corynebacterium ramonii]|uniref:hypothetical protein n=1 Tax=Corynebacterium ramonii TaxID=3026968 RepID=UPI0024B73CB1|nr:hypothetical protein [Corynebacterium ramonii]
MRKNIIQQFAAGEATMDDVKRALDNEPKGPTINYAAIPVTEDVPFPGRSTDQDSGSGNVRENHGKGRRRNVRPHTGNEHLNQTPLAAQTSPVVPITGHYKGKNFLNVTTGAQAALHDAVKNNDAIPASFFIYTEVAVPVGWV